MKLINVTLRNVSMMLGCVKGISNYIYRKEKKVKD